MIVKNTSHKALYAAFDLFPTSKGASTHIGKMAGFLFDYYNGGLLYTLGNRLYKQNEVEGNYEIYRFNDPIQNYLDRAHAFSDHLENTINENPNIEFAHFRDIWSGMAVFQAKRELKSLFEVNGLPSIELPYRYPGLKSKTIKKLKSLEDFCLAKANYIITPSEIIKKNLIDRNISPNKIGVIPNAGESVPSFEKVKDLPENYLIYFGAVQPWQGITTLLKAFASLKDLDEIKLVICCSNRPKHTKAYRKLAEKLEIENNIIWLYQLEKPVLNTWIKNALISLAPLQETERNINQGCSPLKIYESMACGTAVIASDLPVTREIIDNNINGKLVQADRPQDLARAIRILLEYPDLRTKLEKAGINFIKEKRNWNIIEEKMKNIYQSQY